MFLKEDASSFLGCSWGGQEPALLTAGGSLLPGASSSCWLLPLPLPQLPTSAGWLCPLVEPAFWTLLAKDQSPNQAWAKVPVSAKVQVSHPQPPFPPTSLCPRGPGRLFFPRLLLQGWGDCATFKCLLVAMVSLLDVGRSLDKPPSNPRGRQLSSGALLPGEF